MEDERVYSFPLTLSPPRLSGALTPPASCSHMEAVRRQDSLCTLLCSPACTQLLFIRGSESGQDRVESMLCSGCGIGLPAHGQPHHLPSLAAIPLGGLPSTPDQPRPQNGLAELRAAASHSLTDRHRHNIDLQTHGSVIIHGNNLKCSGDEHSSGSAGLVLIPALPLSSASCL